MCGCVWFQGVGWQGDVAREQHEITRARVQLHYFDRTRQGDDDDAVGAREHSKQRAFKARVARTSAIDRSRAFAVFVVFVVFVVFRCLLLEVLRALTTLTVLDVRASANDQSKDMNERRRCALGADACEHR